MRGTGAFERMENNKSGAIRVLQAKRCWLWHKPLGLYAAQITVTAVAVLPNLVASAVPSKCPSHMWQKKSYQSHSSMHSHRRIVYIYIRIQIQTYSLIYNIIWTSCSMHVLCLTMLDNAPGKNKGLDNAWHLYIYNIYNIIIFCQDWMTVSSCQWERLHHQHWKEEMHSPLPHQPCRFQALLENVLQHHACLGISSHLCNSLARQFKEHIKIQFAATYRYASWRKHRHPNLVHVHNIICTVPNLVHNAAILLGPPTPLLGLLWPFSDQPPKLAWVAFIQSLWGFMLP